MPKPSKLSLLDIFSSFEPRLMSNGQIRMRCPFRENHKDGSGNVSFFVTPSMNVYHCFSCRSKGNVVRLLTSRFDVGYFDAVELVKLTPYIPDDKKSFELDISWDTTKLPKEFIKR